MQKNIKEPKNINIKRIIRRAFKALAFGVLFVFAAYGLRHLFSVMQDELSMGLTIGIILGLGYVIFGDE